MKTTRERAIAKLAELTKTPPFVVRAAFDEFGLVAIGEEMVARYAAKPDDVTARAVADEAVAELVKAPA